MHTLDDQPKTDQQPRIVATLIVDYVRRRSSAFQPERPAIVGTTLKPMLAVDFYRGRPGGR